MAKTRRVKFEFNEHSLVSLERLREQGAFVMSDSSDCSTEPIHEETGEGIQAVLQELEEIAEKLRFKVSHVMTPRTNLHIYFSGKLSAYDAAVKAVRDLQ